MALCKMFILILKSKEILAFYVWFWDSCPQITDVEVEKLGADLATLDKLKDVYMNFNR